MGVLFSLVCIIYSNTDQNHSHSTLQLLNSVSKNPIPDAEVIFQNGIIKYSDKSGLIDLLNIDSEKFVIHKINYHSMTLKEFPADGIIYVKPISFLADEVIITEKELSNTFNLPIKTFHIQP